VFVQEARGGRALPGGGSVRRRPAQLGRSLPAHTQRPQQADDRRLPRQPAARVQHGSAQVFPPASNL